MLKKYLLLGVTTLGASLLLEALPYPILGYEKPTPQNSSSTEYYLAQARTYTVKLGDTLSGIAVKTGVSFGQLLSYNPSLKGNPHLIQIGQVIYLSKSPAPTKSPIAVKTPAKRQSVQAFNLPSQRRTASNRVGARRGDPKQECRVNNTDTLRVLLPDTNFGYTLQDYPTLFWYMPQLKSAPNRLELMITSADKDNYKTYKFSPSSQNAGVMSLILPSELGPLEEGKEYKWEIRLYCTSEMFITATGNIQRLSSNNPELTKKLESVSIEDYPAILAQAGVWYDALSTLAALRQDKPNDSGLAQDWANLLKMIGFEKISSAPLVATDSSRNP